MSEKAAEAKLVVNTPSGHRHLIDDIADMFDGFSDSDDVADMSDDALMHSVRDASHHLANEDIPREDRPEYIMAGLKLSVWENIESELVDFEHLLALMFDL